ncbi:flagellin [Bacillus sp. RC240]|uniref:flagellin N-terminal helical domain-containing protein n=1 Tax=Bacillus sp. RC240 TaxID=3156285 RepID=UPI00383937DE
MRINTNINSMRTQEYMRQNQAKMSNAMDRLSSGKRINNASDDAAGLAIATRMRARESGLGVAADNTQNGMSLIRTADSAMNSVSNILLRMRDLANQSANGTNTDKNQVALQKEFAALTEQISYIADNTQFNDKNLLKSDNIINIQTLDSSNEQQQIGINLKGITLDKLGIKDIAIGATEVKKADVTTFTDNVGKLTKDSDADAIKGIRADFDKIKGGMNFADVKKVEDAISAFDPSAADGDKTTAMTNLQNLVDSTKTGAVSLPKGTVEIKQEDIDSVKSKITNLKKDATDVTAITDALAKIKDGMKESDYTKLETALKGFKTGDDSTVTAIQNAFKDDVIPKAGTINLDDNKANSLAAIAAIDNALTTVADNRATLGATLNRLDFNVNNLKSQASSMASAASQIEDADMAKEMSEMTKFKILNEAGISMLSQANQTPQMVSKLLQ